MNPLFESKIKLPLADISASAGFPNPCEDYSAKRITLDDILVSRPSSTFLFQVEGDSMSPTLEDGSYIVVDRSISVKDGHIVVATIDGQFVVKQIKIKTDLICFVSHNPHHSPVCFDITDDDDWESGVVWGVVTGSVRRF